MTREEKQALYVAGKWIFEVPPVCTAHWDDASWVKWIDHCNGWRPESAGYVVKP